MHQGQYSNPHALVSSNYWYLARRFKKHQDSHFPDCPKDKLYHEESHISTSYLIPHTPVRASFISLFLKFF